MTTTGRTRRVITSILSGAATAGLMLLLPRVVGSTWKAVGDVLSQVPLWDLAALAVVWIGGLWSHSFVLAASLPGLTRRRGLTLNLTGSAVANVLPLGGAAGTGLNYAMTRRWGFSPAAFGGFLAVTTLLNVVAKLGVVAVALALVPFIHSASAFSATSLLFLPVPVAVAVVVWVLADVNVATAFGRAVDRLIRTFRRDHRSQLASTVPELRHSVLRVLRAGWRPMTVGMLAYLALQLALLWLCFQVLGISLGLPVLVTALAVGQLLSLVPVTPGSAGVFEVGTAAALVALGGDPAGVTAGLLLFRGFTYLLEIPVGGVTLAIWCWTHRRPAAREAVAG
ncbi:lysylphosphatidylglycerol synthase transmembrane domain-containing protein [Kribbella turkmenica]|nr:YbhN family protein [Kribbella turkmenica]